MWLGHPRSGQTSCEVCSPSFSEPIEQPIYKSFACALALGLLKALTLL